MVLDPGEPRVRVDGGHRLGQKPAPGEKLGRPRAVVDAGLPLLGKVHHERDEIARVHELRRIGLEAGGQHLPATRDALRPIGKAVGRVAGADDVTGAHDVAPGAKRLHRDGLRLRLADAEVGRALRRRRDRPRLGGVGVGVRVVHMRGGDEEVAPGLFEERRRRAHPAGVGGGIIEHEIPAASGERAEVALWQAIADGPIADEAFDRAREVGVAAPPREYGYLVPSRHGVAHQVGPDETGAAQDQDAHRRGGAGGQDAFGGVRQSGESPRDEDAGGARSQKLPAIRHDTVLGWRGWGISLSTRRPHPGFHRPASVPRSRREGPQVGVKSLGFRRGQTAEPPAGHR